MEPQMNAATRRWRMPYLCLSAFIGGSILFLPPRAAYSQQRREGLDSVSEEALMGELAIRGLDPLLERAFQVNNVPEAQRQSQRSIIAMSRLTDPNSKLTPAQRQQMIADAVRGVDRSLATMNDPNVLMRQAYVLISQAAERDVNTLEYWGNSAKTQASLRPVMQAVAKILDRCIERAKALSAEAANKITAPNSPAVTQYDQYERLAATAEYTRRMADYYLCLSLDIASPERNTIASAAFDYLTQFDVPENADRGFVRNRMAKLAMVRNDFDTARTLFVSTINDNGTPPPTIAQQYEARYFLAVSSLLARKLPEAKEGLESLLAWQGNNLPADKTSRDGADAAAAMLKYRIASLESEIGTPPQARAEANAAAVAILMDLLARRPDLRSVIYDQLLPKLDDNAEMVTIEPLLLRALISRAEQEIQKPRTTTVDEKSLRRGAEAAAEVVRRGISNGIDASMLDASALLLPFFYDRMNRKVEAGGAFLDYVQKFTVSNPSKATLALDNAQAIIGELRNAPATRDDTAVTRLYERYLPLAVSPPFNRKQFAFEYARRLQLNGEAEKAIEYYRQVPSDDKRLLQAAFLELVATKQLLDDAPLDAARRPQVLADIQKLADRVNSAVDQAIAQATTDEQRNSARSMRVRSVLLAADLARREQKDPKRALQLLEKFEEAVAGLPSPDVLINEAMYIRVQSNMAAGQYTQAADDLVRLLSKTEGSQGAQIVYNLLEKINADFDRAQQAGDSESMRSLSGSRAQLSGSLVTWAASNSDPGIKAFTYRYRVFDAESQRRAAELETDPAKKQQLLSAAIQRYQALQSPESVALYKAAMGAAAGNDPGLFDPSVSLGIAMVQYEMGDYQKAAENLSVLISQRKLGSPIILTEESGVQRSVDNDQYWEAVLKLVRSNQKLNRDMEDARNFLKRQKVTWDSHFGGKKWKSELNALCEELIPGFKVESGGPSTAPQ